MFIFPRQTYHPLRTSYVCNFLFSTNKIANMNFEIGRIVKICNVYTKFREKTSRKMTTEGLG